MVIIQIKDAFQILKNERTRKEKIMARTFDNGVDCNVCFGLGTA